MIEVILMCAKIPADNFESISYHISFIITYIMTTVNLIVRFSVDVNFVWKTSMDRRCVLMVDIAILVSLLLAFPKYCYSEHKRIQLERERRN